MGIRSRKLSVKESATRSLLEREWQKLSRVLSLCQSKLLCRLFRSVHAFVSFSNIVLALCPVHLALLTKLQRILWLTGKVTRFNVVCVIVVLIVLRDFRVKHFAEKYIIDVSRTY